MKNFTPRDLIVVVVAVSAALVLTPVGVMAAASQLVTVKDPATSSKARVDSGKLRVGDGNGAMTVNGEVSSRMAAPTNAWNTINDITLHAGDTRRAIQSGTGGNRLNLTSVTIAAEGPNAGSVEILVIAYVRSDNTSGDCETLNGFGAAERFTTMVPVGQTVNLVYPSPLQWTQYADANDFYCIDVESFGGPTGYTVHFSASGFLS